MEIPGAVKIIIIIIIIIIILIIIFPSDMREVVIAKYLWRNMILLFPALIHLKVRTG